MKTILSIGEASLDSFMFIHDANVHCTLDKSKCEFCMKYADKVMADDCVFTVGGNAANTAVAFARLGLESQLFSVRGDDWIGQIIGETLDKEKVDNRYIQVEPGPSSYATALVFQGERNLVVYHVPRQYHLPNFDPVDWVYLTSMGKSFGAAYEKALTFIKKTGVKVSFNPGSFQLKSGIDALRPYLAVTEALFVNTDEARLLTELPASATFRQLSEALYDFGPKIINITDGANGAYAFDGQKLLFCEIFPGTVIERTGAGDSYASGFTAALVRGEDIGEAIRWGMANSTSVVTKIGPQAGLLTSDQMAESLNDNHTISPTLVK